MSAPEETPTDRPGYGQPNPTETLEDGGALTEEGRAGFCQLLNWAS
jgi:hypothetical protein